MRLAEIAVTDTDSWAFRIRARSDSGRGGRFGRWAR
jgi:hypothetical protein